MAHYPLYTQNLSLVGVCVKRIGKPRGLGFTLHIDFRTEVKSISINEENITHISEERLRDLISNIAKQRQKHIDVAISRWRKSKESFNGLADQFIDLLIALSQVTLDSGWPCRHNPTPWPRSSPRSSNFNGAFRMKRVALGSCSSAAGRMALVAPNAAGRGPAC